MRVDVNWGHRNTNATFRIKAKDVVGVLKILNTKEEWGRFDGIITEKSAKAIYLDADGNAIRVRFSPSYKITMPSWSEYRKQPERIQSNWDAMWKALKKHEEGHFEIFMRGFKKLIADLEALNGEKGSDVIIKIEKATSMIQEEHDTYDIRTENGKNTGVVLVL